MLGVGVLRVFPLDLLRDNEFSDGVFYVAMSYILQKRSEFNEYEAISNTPFTPTPKGDIISYALKSHSLEVVSYAKILNEFTYDKEGIYTEILKRYV